MTDRVFSGRAPRLWAMAIRLILALALGLGMAGSMAAAQDNNGNRFGSRDGGSRGDLPSRATISSRDAVTIRGGQVEYIVSGPPAQSNAAIAALQGLGAQLRRFRDYPNLNRRVLFFAFPRNLSLALAQQALDQAAPQSFVDVHTLYRYAQGGPRLYAPQMVGDPAPGRCRLAGVTIGLIDGPVDTGHPALAGVRVVAESVLSEGERAPDAAHGTAVASLIAGQDPAGALSGFAPGAQLHAITAFTRDRSSAAADIERIGAAIDRLVGQGVRLVNMSFAGPQNRAFADVLSSAAGRGAVMIAAAGNGGGAIAAYPAAHPDVIAVTAIDAGYNRYRRANTGGHIEFAAPGVDLFVATGRGGSYASGTSYAAPIVTALAARMARGASVGTVRERLRAAAADLGQPGRDAEFGWGLVRSGGC